MINNLNTLKSKYVQVRKGAKKWGADVKAQAKTLKARFDTALGALKTDLTEIGQKIGPFVAKIFTGIEKVVGAFTNLPAPVQDAILAFAGLLAILGPLLLIGGAIVTAIATIGAVMTPTIAIIAGVVAGVAALTAGLIYAYKHSQKFRTIVNTAFRQIWAVVQPIIADLKTIIMGFVNVAIALWHKFGSTIVGYLERSFRNIAQVIRGILKIIHGILDVFIGLFTGDWKRMWKGIREIVGGAIDVIEGVLKQGWNAIRAAAKVVWIAIKTIILNVVKTIADFFLGGISKMLGAIASLMDAASHLPFVGDKFKGIAKWVRHAQGTVDGLKGKIDRLPNSHVTNIRVNAASAFGSVRSIQRAINSIHGKTAHVRVVRTREYDKALQLNHRAGGGPVKAGSPYVVGEVGPELFVPKVNGSIVSNDEAAQGGRGAGRGGDVYVSVTVEGSVHAERDLARAIAGPVRDEIVKIGRRDGNTGL
jgi:phage-related protein